MRDNRRLRPPVLAVGLVMGLLWATPVLSGQGATMLACGPFEYAGKPINPALVREFEPYVSDGVPPITVKLNVSAATGTNEYFEPAQEVRHGEIGDNHDGPHFTYRVVGCANGTYALRTFTRSEGSGIFQSLLLVRMSREPAYDADGVSRSPQTFLTVQRRLVLGDRDTAEITVDGSILKIGTSRYRDRVLRIDLGQSQRGNGEDD